MGVLTGLGEVVRRRWREPDDGIWEMRGPRRHHIYSKVMCWVALDRALRMPRRGPRGATSPVGAPTGRRWTIRTDRGAAAATRELDATSGPSTRRWWTPPSSGSPLAGFVRPPTTALPAHLRPHPRALDAGGPPLPLPRSDSTACRAGRAPSACAPSGSWTALALAGRVDEARGALRAACWAGPTTWGSTPRRSTPTTGAFLGNFPQAFTHIGLINAAVTIEACRPGERATNGARGSTPPPPRGRKPAGGGAALEGS